MYTCMKMRKRADGGVHIRLQSRSNTPWQVSGFVIANGFINNRRVWTGEILQKGPDRDELWFGEDKQPSSFSRAEIIDLISEELLTIHHGDGNGDEKTEKPDV